MNARRLLLCATVALVPVRSMAQNDDLLTPLTPGGEKPQPKKKAAKKKRGAKPQPSPRKASAEDAFDPLLAPLVPAKAELLVRVSGPQSGAEVLVDGKEVRAGQKVEVDAGEHTVVARRPGWAELTRKVKLEQGQSLQVAVSMDAVAGILSVTADVPGSEVLLDGKVVGDVPVDGLLVEPGSHEVIVRRDGYEDSVSNLAVRAGRDYTVRAALELAGKGDRPEVTRLVPEPEDSADSSYGLTDEQAVSAPSPWYQRWYVWAGVGAVAAAAITTAVVTSNTGGAPLSPSEVCGGPCDDVINPPAGALRF